MAAPKTKWTDTPARAAARLKAKAALKAKWELVRAITSLEESHGTAKENAAAESCLKVLHSGVDTLELYTTAKVRPEVMGTFERLKREAMFRKKTGDTRPVVWPCLLDDELEAELEMCPKGAGAKGCAYRLTVENTLDLLVHSNPPEGSPAVYVELRSRFLWGRGFKAAAAIAEELMRVCCRGELDVQVTRIDLAADFMGWTPQLDLLSRFTGRAVSKDAHLEYDDEREDSVGLHLAGRRFTGFSFGRGVVVARLYNKSVEIRRKNKLWFRPLWRKGGFRDEPRDGDVWRLEFQLRRAAVKKAHVAQPDEGQAQETLDVHSWAGCSLALGNIWRMLSKRWLSLRLPRGANERVRLTAPWAALHEQPDFPSVAHAELYRQALDASAKGVELPTAGYLSTVLARTWQREGAPAFLYAPINEGEVVAAQTSRAVSKVVKAFEEKHGASSFLAAAFDKFRRLEAQRILHGDDGAQLALVPDAMRGRRAP